MAIRGENPRPPTGTNQWPLTPQRLVLSLWKLRVGVEAYYLSQVASGLDDYYHGSGEAAGEWVGFGCTDMRVSGEVISSDLQAVMAGLRPGTGLTPNGTLLTTNARRVPGFDLTFSVPKSVSIIYALGDPRIQGAVIEAGEQATRLTLAWLEREACFVRRGSNNQQARHPDSDFGTKRMIASGFVGAMFRHRTSRAGDPQLHWHVLLANIARGADGRWSALDGYALYQARRAASGLFQVELRRELVERLGVEFGPIHKDIGEIAGIPHRVLRAFSQRRIQIEEWLDAHGRSGVIAAQQATLATRTRKADVDQVGLDVEWKQRATALGWGPAELETLLAHAKPGRARRRERWVIPAHETGGQVVGERLTRFEGWLSWLLDTQLTAHESTFTRHDLTQAIASALPVGASISRVEHIVGRALACDEIVAIHGTVDRTERADRRFSTRSLLAVEEQFRWNLQQSGRVSPVNPTAALAGRPLLGLDQRDAVMRLTRSALGVRVLVGHAGTGKTYTLNAVRETFEAGGFDVIGLAPSARAARELQDGSGIDSTTIAAWRIKPNLTPNTVLVVDEAGMAGIRDLAAILNATTSAGVRLILVGDHHQLPEVAAGGGFAVAVEQLGPLGRVSELTVNRRQRHVWEHEALEHLRNGDVTTAWNTYQSHGAIVITDNAEQLQTQLLDEWTTLAASQADVLVLTGTRAQAAILNQQARLRWQHAGHLVGPVLDVHGRPFQTGDKVVMLRNDPNRTDTDGRQVRVDNGMTGTVTNIDLDNGEMIVAIKGRDRHVVLDHDYLAAGGIDHGYAMTIHKAQGVTCDNVFVVGPDGLYREGIYVALSRARGNARLYATTQEVADLDERHKAGIPLPSEIDRDPEEELLARFHRSGRKQFATGDNPDAARVAALADKYTAPMLAVRLQRATAVEQAAAHLNPTTVIEQYGRSVAFRTYAEPGRRVRTADRGNVGTITAINDNDGTTTVTLVSPEGKTAQREFAWHQLIVIDHPTGIELGLKATAHLDVQTRALDNAQQTWIAYLGQHGLEPGDRHRYQQAWQRKIEQAAARLAADPPSWLLDTLGKSPDDPIGASVWNNAAVAAAEEHAQQGHPQRFKMENLNDQLKATQEWLALRPGPDAHPETQLSKEQLRERMSALHDILTTAPADQRDNVKRALRNQTTTTQLASSILDHGPSERSAWILKHWPHLIERHQLQSRLDQYDLSPLVNLDPAVPEP